jgi:hypothetical protein
VKVRRVEPLLGVVRGCLFVELEYLEKGAGNKELL